MLMLCLGQWHATTHNGHRINRCCDCTLMIAANPEEIELGDDDDEEDAGGAAEPAEDEGAEVQEKAVPAAVFGSLAQNAQQEQGEQQLGALDRFKKRRVE